ncbi:PREDICTED: uncharacterized protein LOC101297654 [Fragaria vesca subsp. vesca]|uniref:uncharacterized protein LOC101297654 n=1 Tax=Fragaria vesca subsp. vesca TaxID=101020 RepID=UPI0002C31138|nr:PREDICTED: uncharacterized protein LOC101297654 [Fragaria vesca subsp. vesca]
MSFVEIDSMLQGINPAHAHQRIDYWYRVGDERGCLMKLESDWDVLVMCTPVPLVRLIFLYLDHKEPEDDDFLIYEDLFVMQPSNVLIEEARPSKGVVIKEHSEGVPTQCSIAGGKNNKEKGKQKQLEVPKVMKPRKKVVQLAWEGSNDIGQSSNGFGSSVVEQGNLLQNVAGNLQDFDNFDFLDFLQSYGGQRQGRLGYEDEPSNSEDSDYDPLPDDEDYDKYGDDEDDYIVEEIVDEEEQRKRSLLNGYDGSINGENMLQGGKEFIDNEDMFGGVDSDEEPPNYIVNFDGEREEQGLYFNPKIDMVRPRFQLNMMFGSVMILRDALRLMALLGGWEY